MHGCNHELNPLIYKWFCIFCIFYWQSKYGRSLLSRHPIQWWMWISQLHPI